MTASKNIGQPNKPPSKNSLSEQAAERGKFWRANPQTHIAAQAVLEGRVIAYPTEAVWGLGCSAFDSAAVEQILFLKSRPVHKGLIIVAGTMAQVDFLLEDLPAQQLACLGQSWPGHNTWLVPHCGRLPVCVTGEHQTVALRVSNHPMIRAICARIGGPIVSTSANPAGKVPARTAYRVRQYFGDHVIYAPGQVGKQAQPSTIRDLQSGAIIRA